MAEETKKRGRKPKAENENKDTTTDVVVENNKTDEKDELLKQMMAKIAELEAQIKDTNTKEINTATTTVEKSNVQVSRVKVVSLLENQLNLSTEPNGAGKVFTFNKLGDMVTMRVSDLEDVLSIPSYREQAEKGYFYICDANIVEEQDLTYAYEKINDEKSIRKIEALDDDSCVDMFLGLKDELQTSIATKMAEDLTKGKALDRNRLAKIKIEGGIDIEKMADELKETMQKVSKDKE